MSEINEYKPGTFCWPELGTTDSEGAKKFYRELFHWETDDNPVGPGMVYTMIRLKGREVGALYQLSPEMKAQGVPPHWASYVSVSNVDDVVKKVESLGGNVMKGAFEVMDAGRMAVIQDPTGAVFCLWEPGKNIGATIVNEPGAFCWNELITTDTAKAGDFYTGLFGWKKQEQQMGPMTYTSFMNGDRPAGGMYSAPKEWGQVPPHWLVYFAVDNCDRTVDQTRSLGGSVKLEATDIPGVGRFAILSDPQGVTFAVIKLSTVPS